MRDRARARRQFILAVDRLLTTVERCWVTVAGGRQRRREGRRVDRTTGRTTLEHLRERGIGRDLWPRLRQALDGEHGEEVAAGFKRVTEEAAERLAAELHTRAPQMLRDHRAVRRGMQRRIDAIWGPALDALYEVYVCVEELGSDLQQLHGSGDSQVQALLALHARACLVLAEIHALLREGLPLGAWARTRSLHETAVIATVLEKYGREAGTEDLSQRFLLHAVVDEARDLELAVRNGVTVDMEELDRVRHDRASLVARFGPMFAKDYGWARPLFPSIGTKERVTFEALEDLAKTGLYRLDYRLGGHHVHSSAWTLALNMVPRGGVVYRLSGPTNIGLADPATVALAATLVSTSAIVHGVAQPPEPMHLVSLEALHIMSDRATGLFDTALLVLHDREARIQARAR